MKTLSLTVLLLLITLHCCSAASHEPKVSESCCFNFFDKRIPKTEMISITKTHSRCSEKAFVFETYRGKICVRQTLDWAEKAYEQQGNYDQ